MGRGESPGDAAIVYRAPIIAFPCILLKEKDPFALSRSCLDFEIPFYHVRQQFACSFNFFLPVMFEPMLFSTLSIIIVVLLCRVLCLTLELNR